MTEPCVVCVPARDEAERLPRLLRSLAAQTGFGSGAPLPVVVVANNCRDGTSEAAREAASRLPAIDLRLIEIDLPPDEAHVGTGRRMALDSGADWLAAQGAPDGVLLTTDADARLPPDWVAANLAALCGAEIVGGRLLIDPDVPLDPALADLHARIERYWAHVRRLEDVLDPPAHDPAPRHGDHTGASLALRAGLYREVGGLPALPRGEDNALVARVREAGGRLRHCPGVGVAVSDRTLGRADGGMAREMTRRAAIVRGEAAYRLPTPEHWLELIAGRARLGRIWREQPEEAEAALRALGLDRTVAAQITAGCPNAIAFVERASRHLGASAPPAPETDLDAALRGFEAWSGPAAGR